jgi:hypothetical protein
MRPENNPKEASSSTPNSELVKALIEALRSATDEVRATQELPEKARRAIAHHAALLSRLTRRLPLPKADVWVEQANSAAGGRKEQRHV